MDMRDSMLFHTGLQPTNLAAAAANSAWVSLKNFNHIQIVINKGPGAAGEPPTFSFKQATTVTGTNSKALTYTKYTRKSHATDAALVTVPTVVTVAAASTLVLAAGDTGELLVFEFDAQNLDAQNGFDCLRVEINDPGATAQTCAITYVLTECRGDPKVMTLIAN